ncbi:DUF2726 domain-containing protein [Rhodobacterales bacterium HKCCE2091]|nr:DUF2726 domain-containing protein [Rhodobacterales bacterium HKCCE2091]
MELLFVALFAIVVAIAAVLEKATRRSRRNRSGTQQRRFTPGGMADPKNQLDAVQQVFFEKKRIMNKAEYRVFRALEEIVAEVSGGYRVMAQVSLGEVIGPVSQTATWQAKKDAFASVNSKRLDFAVIDREGFVALAVEYQGGGHYQESAFIRDAVKKEALRRAGVPFMEVAAGKLVRRELRAMVRKELGVMEPVAAE